MVFAALIFPVVRDPAFGHGSSPTVGPIVARPTHSGCGVAHGEISNLVSDLSDYDPTAEQMAVDQESKMRSFVSEWFNTAPDVQEGHIRGNRWGLMRFNSGHLVCVSWSYDSQSYEIQLPAHPTMCHAPISFDR
jgi:hypothetical protein